jgi:hypothetical protein
MTAAGVSPVTIAQMLGHSSTQIVPRYAQVLDQNRFDAMKRLEALRQSSISNKAASAWISLPNKSTRKSVRGKHRKRKYIQPRKDRK